MQYTGWEVERRLLWTLCFILGPIPAQLGHLHQDGQRRVDPMLYAIQANSPEEQNDSPREPRIAPESLG